MTSRQKVKCHPFDWFCDIIFAKVIHQQLNEEKSYQVWILCVILEKQTQWKCFIYFMSKCQWDILSFLSALHSTRWRIIAMGFDIRVKQYWELLKILKMFTICSVVAKLKFTENGVLNVKLNIFHNRKLSSNLHDHI